jgi:hypothetical protein
MYPSPPTNGQIRTSQGFTPAGPPRIRKDILINSNMLRD